METKEVFVFQRTVSMNKDTTVITKTCDTTEYKEGIETVNAVIARFLGFMVDSGFDQEAIATSLHSHVSVKEEEEDYSLLSAIEGVVSNETYKEEFNKNLKDPDFVKALFRMYVTENHEKFLVAVDINED